MLLQKTNSSRANRVAVGAVAPTSLGRFQRRAWLVSSAIAATLGLSHSGNAAPISLTNAAPYAQNFDSMVTAENSQLPAGWGFNQGTTYSSGLSVESTRNAGTSGTGALAGASAGGTYLFVNGVLASGTDKAIGYLSSGSFSDNRNILVAFTNNTGSTISDFALSWNYEKYRFGTASRDWTFFASKDDTAWGTAISAGGQSYAADASNAVVNPPTSISKSIAALGISLLPTETVYLRWNYDGSGTGSSGQALAIDDFSITPILAASNPALTYSNTAGAAFGNLLLGAVATTTVTITNTGAGASTAITPGSLAGFTLADPLDETLAVGEFTTAVITAVTSTPGVFSGTATYTADPGAVISPGFMVSATVGQAAYGDSNATRAATPLNSTLATALSATGTGLADSGTPKALNTVVSVLFYDNETAGDSGTVQMKLRTRTPGEASLLETLQTTEALNVGGSAKYLYSDVVDLTGMADVGTTTDVFVLQLSYDPALLFGYEATAASEGNIFLATKSGGEWVNAVLLNTLGSLDFVGDRPYAPGDELFVGRYGVDTASNTVWAVLNHNSEFAVIPEPSSIVLGAIASLGFLGYRLRRKQS